MLIWTVLFRVHVTEVLVVKVISGSSARDRDRSLAFFSETHIGKRYFVAKTVNPNGRPLFRRLSFCLYHDPFCSIE